MAVMHGQALSHSLVPSSTVLQPHGEIGDMLAPTPERAQLRGGQLGRGRMRRLGGVRARAAGWGRCSVL